MDISFAVTDNDVFQYMLNHGNSWVPQESIMECRSNLVFSCLVSQQNVREIIKIEEMDPVSSDGNHCLSDATGDVRDKSYELDICSPQFPTLYKTVVLV